MTKDAKQQIHWAALPLIATVARLLCRELTLQVDYLVLENKILKSKFEGRRIRFTDDERLSLAEAALALGRKLMGGVVNIVKPDTILAWQRRLERKKWDYSGHRRRKPGRPRTQAQTEALVVRMARENEWGYKRISGELQKLGIRISKSCIADILRRNGLPPSPQRKGLTWRQFLSRHADVLLCADFLTKEVWTFTGLKTAHVLFVVHLRTRRVVLSEATFSPDKPWMSQAARNVLLACEDLSIEPRFVLHDRECLFVHGFDRVLETADVEVVKTPHRAPNAHAHAERWVRSAREECLSHLILFGLDSLRRVLSRCRGFHNGDRPHQGLGNEIPACAAKGQTSAVEICTGTFDGGKVECTESLGGLLKSYSLAA